MAKKKARKPTGAAGIAVIGDETESETDELPYEANGNSGSETRSAKPGRTPKTKPNQQSTDNLGVGDIKKGAAFVNAVGGLDKAIAVLQILKVAKEMR